MSDSSSQLTQRFVASFEVDNRNVKSSAEGYNLNQSRSTTNSADLELSKSGEKYTNGIKPLDQEKQDHRYKFKFVTFLKVFFIYVLFFGGLGPTMLLLRPAIPNTFISNVIQIVIEGQKALKLLIISVIPFLYFAYFAGYLSFQLAEIHMLIGTLIFIAVSQSTMIAYTHDRAKKQLGDKTIEFKELVQLSTFGIQNPREELKNAVIRLNVDLSILYFNFLLDKEGEASKMPKTAENESEFEHEGREHIVSIQSLGEAVIKKENQMVRLGSRETVYDDTKSYGENLALEMLKTLAERKGKDGKRIRKDTIFWAVFQSLIPVVYQGLASRPATSDTKDFVLFILLIIGFWFMNFFCALYVMNILRNTISIVRDKIFLMKQMGNLIAPYFRAHNGKEKKYYLEILDPMSIRTWANIRKILMHYGNQILKITTLSVTLVMGFHFILMILTILHYLGIVSLGASSYEYGVVFGFGSIVYFVLLGELIWAGASLNYQFSQHKEYIHADKSTVTTLIRLYPNFIADKKPLRAQTFINKAGIKRLEQEFGRDSTPQQREEKLYVLLETYDDILEELTFEEIHHPFRLMGIAMTKALTTSILAGLFSAVVAATPKLLSII